MIILVKSVNVDQVAPKSEAIRNTGIWERIKCMDMKI